MAGSTWAVLVKSEAQQKSAADDIASSIRGGRPASERRQGGRRIVSDTRRGQPPGAATSESFLACRLFERVHRRIVFTEAGEQYWSKIHATLGEIRFVTQDISATSDSRPLVIGSPRVFLQKCVLPVLGTFYASHPEIAVKFVIGGEDDDVMDGAIRVGTGAAPKGYVSEILADGDLCPVCSPSYLTQSPAAGRSRRSGAPRPSSFGRIHQELGALARPAYRRESSPGRASSILKVPGWNCRPPSRGSASLS